MSILVKTLPTSPLSSSADWSLEMTVRIVFENAEGGVSITPLQASMSAQELAARVVPAGVPWSLVSAADIPADRAFRNAWTMDGGKVKEDWAKSVELTKERLRKERAPLLAAADVNALRDIETTGAVSAETVELKQALRDVTALADAAKSRGELLALKAAAVVKA